MLGLGYLHDFTDAHDDGGTALGGKRVNAAPCENLAAILGSTVVSLDVHFIRPRTMARRRRDLCRNRDRPTFRQTVARRIHLRASTRHHRCYPGASRSHPHRNPTRRKVAAPMIGFLSPAHENGKMQKMGSRKWKMGSGCKN